MESPELMQQPTQARHPWRATARTTFAAAVAILPALPEIANVLGISTVPVVASALSVTALVTRILAIPEVDFWLDRYFPLFSADIGYIENKEVKGDAPDYFRNSDEIGTGPANGGS